MSQTKVKSGLLNFPDQTDFVKLPSGTTAQRPSSPEKGYSRYNTTDNKLEFWNGTEWQQLPGLTPPIITSISYPGDDLAADPDGGQTITINGGDFKAGATVTVDGTTPSVITFVSATEITFTAPAKTAGDYDIVVTNLDGGNATAVDGMTYNGLPSWTTPAGNLGTFPAGSTIPTITLVATEPDSSAISYSITTGGLPNGLTLTGADIDGTTPAVAGETTYNFTVTATDNENQSTERAFNIIVYKLIPSFNTVTYTGAQGTQPRSITGVGFKPDFVWIKERTSTSSHSLADIVRGAGLILQSDLFNAEINVVANLVSFDSDGFTIHNSNGVNETGQDYVAWCWKAGGSSVTNTDGTITSQVSANTEAGFSIVSWQGIGEAQSIGHGLNAVPSVIIHKRRTVGDWEVYTSTTGANQKLLLNGTNAAASSSAFGNTTPTSDVYYAGAYADPMISYCFAEVEGFSKFGSYTGTGSAGNKQTIGFEPAFLLIKKTQGYLPGNPSYGWSWYILDNKRSTSNVRKDILEPNTSSAEQNLAYGINFLSDGFDFETNFFNDTGYGETYIYMAFANQF